MSDVEEYIKTLSEVDKKLLITPKLNQHIYTKEQIETTLELLEQGKSPHEISIIVDMAPVRIKKIRFIKERGNPEDIEVLLTCKYMISRLCMIVKDRVLNLKNRNKVRAMIEKKLIMEKDPELAKKLYPKTKKKLSKKLIKQISKQGGYIPKTTERKKNFNRIIPSNRG